MKALTNFIGGLAGAEPLTGNALYTAAITADLFSNALYYSMIGTGNKKYILIRGATCGITAGLGASTPPSRTGKVQLFSIQENAYHHQITFRK